MLPIRFTRPFSRSLRWSLICHRSSTPRSAGTREDQPTSNGDGATPSVNPIVRGSTVSGHAECAQESIRTIGTPMAMVELLAEFSTVEVNRVAHRRDDLPYLGILSRLGPINHDHISPRIRNRGSALRNHGKSQFCTG